MRKSVSHFLQGIREFMDSTDKNGKLPLFESEIDFELQNPHENSRERDGNLGGLRNFEFQ